MFYAKASFYTRSGVRVRSLNPQSTIFTNQI